MTKWQRNYGCGRVCITGTESCLHAEGLKERQGKKAKRHAVDRLNVLLR